MNVYIRRSYMAIHFLMLFASTCMSLALYSPLCVLLALSTIPTYIWILQSWVTNLKVHTGFA